MSENISQISLDSHKNAMHEKLYSLFLLDGRFLFEDIEKEYNKNITKTLNHHNQRIEFLENFFVLLVEKVSLQAINIIKDRTNLLYLIELCKSVLTDEVYASSRLFDFSLFRDIFVVLQELAMNQYNLASYENEALAQYLSMRLCGAFSLYCLKMKNIPNEEEHRALLLTLKTIFWIIYSVGNLKTLFHKDNQKNFVISDMEISCCFLFLKSFQLTQTFEKIQFYDSMAQYFPAKTFNGSDYLKRRLGFPFFSEDMAIDLINREVAVSKRALSERHEQTILEIQKIYNEKIIPVVQELTHLQRVGEDSLIRYFYSFIPPKFIFRGSKQSSKLSFFMWSIFQRYMNPSFFPIIANFFSALHFYKQEKEYSFIHFPLVKTIGLPLLNLYPGQSQSFEYKANQYAENDLSRFEISQKSENEKIKLQYEDYHGGEDKKFFDFLDKQTNEKISERKKDLVNSKNIILKHLLNDSEKLTLGDKLAYLQHGDYPLSNFFKKYRYALFSKGFVEQLGSSIINGYFLYDSGKSLLRQYQQSVSNNSRYLLLLRKLILYTKQIFDLYQKLFVVLGDQNIIPVPEFLVAKKSFIEMRKNKKHIFNEILSRNNNYFSSMYNGFLGFLAPGLLSHFYFNHLEDNKDIAKLYLFLGYIEFFINKIDLLKKNNISDYPFSLPKLVKKEDAILLDIKNMWFPAGMKNPTKNSILLNEKERNVLLVSPVAGGKTVCLSTLLTVLHMANVGITCAESLNYSYFSKIVDHLTHEYIVGGGLSQHLAERKSMEFIETIVQKNNEEKLILFIDEIFRGTRPDLAIKESFLFLPPILQHKNVIAIITTHFPEMIELTKKEHLAVNLYYLIVDFISGKFERRFLLSKDNENNWWIRDPSLAMFYQQSIKV